MECADVFSTERRFWCFSTNFAIFWTFNYIYISLLVHWSSCPLDRREAPVALFDSHKKCARCREEGVCDSFPPLHTSPGKNKIRSSRLQILLLVPPPPSWTHQSSLFWDGYIKNLLRLCLLARRINLINLPRLVVRKNPAANPGMMNSRTWKRSGETVLPYWRRCYSPRRLLFLWSLWRNPLQRFPVISPFLILEPPTVACPLVWLLGVPVPVLFRPPVRLLLWVRLPASGHPACWGPRCGSRGSALQYRQYCTIWQWGRSAEWAQFPCWWQLPVRLSRQRWFRWSRTRWRS